MNIVIFGLSITSSWGNGHATTYRSLTQALHDRGHRVLFLERDVPWYAENRDLPQPEYATTRLYASVDDAKRRFSSDVGRADLCIVGSYVPEGVTIGEWVTDECNGAKAFYDIDTPVTLSQLENDECEHVSRDLIPNYDLYLSFTGGPVLRRLENEFSAARARPLYCSVDPHSYFPLKQRIKWQLGYMGTYSADRQASLARLLVEPLRRCREIKGVVAGSMYPEEICWPNNVERIKHLAPSEHCEFYNSQKFTLNLTRADMIEAGYSPSVRLFEAAACATPIISDYWRGLETFFNIGKEILVASTADDVLSCLHEMHECDRIDLGLRALRRVLLEHTAQRRAAQLEDYVLEVSPMAVASPREHAVETVTL
jgi:spore maturation protein CgeB